MDKRLLWLAGGAATLVVLDTLLNKGGGTSSSVGFSAPSTNVDFPFLDQVLLSGGQSNGGRAYVPSGVRRPAPLLVFLHGNNTSAMMHRGFADAVAGSSGVVVAAPSQTVNAQGGTLWANFDLDAFVTAVEKATSVAIDRTRVIVAGHSGAACASGSGIFSTWRNVKPRLVVDIDGCMNGVYGAMLGAVRDKGSAVLAYYQSRTWARDYAGFIAALGARGVVEEIKGPFFAEPHSEMVKLALERVFSSPTKFV